MCAEVTTKAAFDSFRVMIGSPRLPAISCPTDEMRQMVDADGLMKWVDGPDRGGARPPAAPLVTPAMEADRHLWAVRKSDVVHARENCPFGSTNAVGVIKHTNLTGGAEAFASGELLFILKQSVIINGKSRRYGPRSESEMTAVAKAFRDSGYEVWSMGYDVEAGLPYPFVGVAPEWVA